LNAVKSYAEEWNEQMIKKGPKKLAERMEVFTIPDLVRRLGRRVEGVNLLEIESYLQTSKVMDFHLHVDGFADPSCRLLERFRDIQTR
jgi:hypothetical protein